MSHTTQVSTPIKSKALPLDKALSPQGKGELKKLRDQLLKKGVEGPVLARIECEADGDLVVVLQGTALSNPAAAQKAAYDAERKKREAADKRNKAAPAAAGAAGAASR